MFNTPTRKRLLALQSTGELARKSVKSERRGYRKTEDSYVQATVENYDFKKRDWDMLVEGKRNNSRLL